MGVRLAYGRREDVEPAIQNGLIPNETLIVTAETLDPEILYYNANNQLITPLKRARFETYEEADQWVKEYPSVGCIIAVRDDTAWAPYIVQEGNILSPLKTGGVIYFDTEQILTNEQQLQARQNINAASENLVYVLKDGETIDDVPDDAVIIYDPADEGLSIEGLDILAEVNMRLDKLFETMPSTTSDLVNDSGFITVLVSDLVNYYSKSETYSRSEIDSKISLIPKFKISVVSSLPASGINETTVYLLSGGNEDNLYTEYIYVNGKWEILGSQHIDLVGYATESWVIDQLSSKLDANKLGEAIEIALEEAKASGEFDGASDVYIGDEASMPAGTKVRINPNGQRMKIPAVDDTLSKAGYTADAKVVGEKFAEQSKSIEEQAERTVPTYTLAEGETPEDAPEWAEEVIDPYNDPEDSGVSKEEFEQLSEAIADLENKIPSGGGNGWSNEEITLLGTILRSTVTSSDQTANIDALIKMLQTGSSGNEGAGGDGTSETYTVTLNLTNVTPSNLSQTAVSGGVYVNVLAVEDGYVLGTPVITMGGFDVTSQYYDSTGTISIPDVQGDIVITCKALAVETLQITRAAAMPNHETFEWTAGAANYWVAEESTTVGGKMHVDFDTNVCTGWSFILYLSQNGTPYKVSTGSNNTANGDGMTVSLMNPAASGYGYVTVTAPFDYDVPDGCTVMLGIRRGSSTSPDGSITSNANFADWINGDGIVVTVTEVE